MRHALLLAEGSAAAFDWTPDSIPADFMLERGAPDPFFIEAASKLGLADMNSDWDRVVAISRHLLGSAPELLGSAIQSDLRDTYYKITQGGVGYCGDFTRVFMAFSLAARIPVRAWAFSFDGFGGNGHILPEVWNGQLRRWQLVDVFNNAYFVGPEGVALSAAEIRRALATGSGSLRRQPLHPGVRMAYNNEEGYINYYRRGLHQWYMVWGNNVYSYDRAVMTSRVGRVSRSLEQLYAIAIDVYPPIKIVVNESNQENVSAIWRLRAHLMVVMWVGTIAAIFNVVCLIGWWACARNTSGVRPK